MTTQDSANTVLPPIKPGETSPSKAVKPITQEIRRLGDQLAVFHGKRIKGFWLIIVLILGITAVILPLIYGLSSFQAQMDEYGWLAAVLWSYPWLVLSVLAFAIDCFLLLRSVYRHSRYLIIHQYGISFRMRGKSKSIFFKEISGICEDIIQERFLSIPIREIRKISLIPSNGKPIQVISYLENLPVLSRLLKENIYPVLLPVLKEQYRKQQWLYFGAIAVNKTGFQLEGKNYKWDEVNSISVQSGHLMVEFIHSLEKKGIMEKFSKVRLSKITNLELLLQFIQQGDQV